MNNYLNALRTNTDFELTENGAITRTTTGSDLLNMFALGGSYRSRSNEDVIFLFKKALEENEEYAMKCLFYLVDCRGGRGERRFFKTCYTWLAKNHPDIARRNMRQIPYYSRWDNLYCLVDTPLEAEMFQFMKEQLALDMQSKTPSLLAKWLKSLNASSNETYRLGNKTRKAFGMTPKQYRRTLSILRERINVLERLMSEGRWDEIEFDKIPSKAGLKYKNAFARHDVERVQNGKQTYAEFAQDETKSVNADVLDPVDIAEKIFNAQSRYDRSTLTATDRAMLDKYWANLKDYYNGREERGIAVVDVSGSMFGKPMNAAVSMGAYIAERGKGPFKDHFITFSDHPKLVKFDGLDITDKFARAISADWGMSTNIEATMDLLLNTAIKNGCTQDEIPEKLYIFSDMEFNACMTSSSSGRWGFISNPETLFETIEKRWIVAGYQMPKVIFWNLDARQDNIPALGNRFSYVSGFSMNMIESILSGKDGYDLMMDKLNSDRYSAIH